MNKFLAVSIFLVANLFLKSQPIGKLFPTTTGQTLEEKKVTIPDNTKNKYTLIAMAYSSDAENDLSTWLNPIYNKFIVKTGMFDSEYDINLFFVPMFSSVNMATANLAEKRMKKEVDKQIHSYVLFYKGDIEPYKNELKMTQKDTPYIFLLDKEGKIVYTTNGSFSEEKIEAIEDKIM
ncbi:MAG: hypothetical protein J0M08_05295 [Bacteroidetes bacterium]|nr:hypothetical protein [Bacteroidota bacterium]